MFYAISIFMGVLIAVMVAINGGLTAYYGPPLATVIIHTVGLIALCVWVFVRRVNPFKIAKLPFYLYLGGAIGVLTTTFNNIAFGKISVSAILALCLLGQSASSIVIDEFGLFKMAKAKFNRKKLIGLAFIILGIALMMIPS